MTTSIRRHDQPSVRSQIPSTKPAADFHRHSGRNVFSLLVQREISPEAKYVPKKRWGQCRRDVDSSCGTSSGPARDAGRSLVSWVEAESLQHLSAKYCPLVPPPRSTIAAAFSSDGRILASTHGDHTVKIIDCETGNCLKVLGGHRRTPWVVRFHPLHSEILASGSLDHEVRLWNAKSSECIKSHDFSRSIASIAFHAEGELLAVASGHKLYIWEYNKRDEDSSPSMVLKTRRSLRAVHFHPHGAPFLLTAEVNDIDSSDSSMTRATTTPGYLRYPVPVTLPYLFAQTVLQNNQSVSSPNVPSAEVGARASRTSGDAMDVDETQSQNGSRSQNSRQSNSVEFGASWELPFLQGWLMAQNHGRSGSRDQIRQTQCSGSGNTQQGRTDTRSVMNRIQSEIATSIAASAASAELPCTAKLRVWLHDIKDPSAHLKADRCRLTIPHAVLCSEMGAHFSPCGRYLAACVACVSPHAESDLGLQALVQHDSGLATSPTRHPLTAHQIVFELRVYSLEKQRFGSVLVSRAIRAAHCLTSIQFSPTSEHVLLAYGRRHGSLLRSIVSGGDTASHLYTVLEIYRVSDMELVRLLPSADDEVNVASFHPSPGGGLVYGTKEGRLRIFQYNTAAASNLTGPNDLPEETRLSEVS